MPILDRLLTRRREKPRFTALKPHIRRRLELACRELTEAEDELAGRLGLPRAPRLLLVDEEEAVIVLPEDRSELG